MRIVMLLLKIALSIALVLGIVLAGLIIYATLTDFQPPEKEDVSSVGNNDAPLTDTLSLMSWNIGYGGLGAESDFFYDGGKSVISPRAWVDKNIAGARQTLLDYADSTDFFLLQEVDVSSKRSYYQNEVTALADALSTYNHAVAINYKVKYVPIPFTSPMGGVLGGVLSLGRFRPSESTRYQYPGRFEWPRRLFFLDRCFLLQRYPLKNGKQLLVLNTHNSAYDTTGKIKAVEMEYLRNFLMSEYNKGNYVIVGGDWNQCPPNFDCNAFIKDNMQPYDQTNVAADFLPADWVWAYDPKIPTNRSNLFPFDKSRTATTLIDYFLLSPNIQLLDVKNINMDFIFSDHQPVWVQVKLK